jgi:hypothetical protein
MNLGPLSFSTFPQAALPLLVAIIFHVVDLAIPGEFTEVENAP